MSKQTITTQDLLSTHMNEGDLLVKKTVKTTKKVGGKPVTMEREFTYDLSNCTVAMLIDFVVQNRAIAHQSNLRSNEELWLNTFDGNADTVDVSKSYRKPAMTKTEKAAKALSQLDETDRAEVLALLDSMTDKK